MSATLGQLLGELRRDLLRARGEASSFSMLEIGSRDPKGEIFAAIETGDQLRETLDRLLLTLGRARERARAVVISEREMDSE